MILDLHRQGLSVSAIARRTGHDRKTIRTYIARGLEPPAYTPRPPTPSPLAPFETFLRDRVGRFPDLTGRLRETRSDRVMARLAERAQAAGDTPEGQEARAALREAARRMLRRLGARPAR